jgi:hypothetical protein
VEQSIKGSWKQGKRLLTLSLNNIIKVIHFGKLRIDKSPYHRLVVMGQDQLIEYFVIPHNVGN